MLSLIDVPRRLAGFLVKLNRNGQHAVWPSLQPFFQFLKYRWRRLWEFILLSSCFGHVLYPVGPVSSFGRSLFFKVSADSELHDCRRLAKTANPHLRIASF